MAISDVLKSYTWVQSSDHRSYFIYRNHDRVAQAKRAPTGWFIKLLKHGERRHPPVFDHPIPNMATVETHLELFFNMITVRYKRPRDIGITVKRKA